MSNQDDEKTVLKTMIDMVTKLSGAQLAEGLITSLASQALRDNAVQVLDKLHELAPGERGKGLCIFLGVYQMNPCESCGEQHGDHVLLAHKEAPIQGAEAQRAFVEKILTFITSEGANRGAHH